MRAATRLSALTGAAGVFLSTSALAQLCPIYCNPYPVVCHHQNGVRNHRGGPTTPIEGPNAGSGNVPGDAFWKVWACENGMTRGSGVHTFTSWEIGATSFGPGTIDFDIPDLALRPVSLAGSAPGVKEPDLVAPATYAAAVGTISLPSGGFRINVSIVTPSLGSPASCPPTTSLPTLPNGHIAMLFLLTPGEVSTQANYYRNRRTDAEVNTISNPPALPTGTGNSYSGQFDASLNVVSHFAIQQELYGEMAFFEPTLEVYRQTTGFIVPTRGAGARELAGGDSFFLRTEDWGAGFAAIAGQDRLAAVVISDTTAGSPLCLAPPGNAPFFLAGNAVLPGSTGVLGLYATGMTLGFLNFTTTLGAGLNCHIQGDVGCLEYPSVATDMQATTSTIPVPPGMTGLVLYAASFALNLTTFVLEDGSNTVELLFL